MATTERRFFRPADVESWTQYLAEFDAVLLPVFARHKVSRDRALLLLELNALRNSLGSGEDVESWQK